MATPIICGVFRFPFLIYLPAMSLGAFLYILFYTLLGYFFGPTMLHLLERLELPLGLIVSIIMLAAITFWVFRIGRRATPPQLCPDLRERLRAGAAGGLIATVTSALLANVLIHLSGLLAYLGPGIGLRRFLALLADGLGREGGPGTAVLLLPAFLIVGIGLGALYGGWLGNSGYVRGTLRGATFSLLPLCLALFVLFPLIGAGVAGLDLRAGLIPALGESIRHLAYGLVLGTVYPALTRPRVGLGEPNPPAPFPAREGGDGVTEGVGERESSGGAHRLGGPNPPAPFPAREGGEQESERGQASLALLLAGKERGAVAAPTLESSPLPRREGGRGVRSSSRARSEISVPWLRHLRTGPRCCVSPNLRD
jgi:hypothetical protein